MYIKELEIDKFKSFANRVNIPFEKGFTTIVGPNGSGKSNIIDAILFALGLATANEMREKKISEFISLYTNSKEASVTVVFDTENPQEPELRIKRKIKKGSQGYNSIYYLNDKPVTLTEVHLVLDKYNVNTNSYNVVMQNAVFKVTDCTPRERRTYLDEIAGVAEFDRKIKQAT
ncbi:AAA family ATPase, partial [bacterium]|nr:AAA family ATPase [bacterium]